MTNVDPKTGIHYGVIHQNSLNQGALHDVLEQATDVAYEEYIEDVRDEFRSVLCDKVGNSNLNDAVDGALDAVEDYLMERYCGEKTEWQFSNDEYLLTDCLDTDVLVLKSPFFTFCKKCSPCVPNAGDLENFEYGGIKTYCLGHEFFDGERAPYPVYEVKTGELTNP